jgi:hypothetical protein
MSQLDAWREIALMEAIVEDYRVAASVVEPQFALDIETRRSINERH